MDDLGRRLPEENAILWRVQHKVAVSARAYPLAAQQRVQQAHYEVEYPVGQKEGDADSERAAPAKAARISNPSRRFVAKGINRSPMAHEPAYRRFVRLAHRIVLPPSLA